jgi:hypothetical protein
MSTSKRTPTSGQLAALARHVRAYAAAARAGDGFMIPKLKTKLVTLLDESSSLVPSGWPDAVGTALANCYRRVNVRAYYQDTAPLEQAISVLETAAAEEEGPPPRSPDLPITNEPGKARLCLEAELDRLIEQGIWGHNRKQVYSAAGISKATFYRLTDKNGPVRKKWEQYQRDSQRAPHRESHGKTRDVS